MRPLKFAFSALAVCLAPSVWANDLLEPLIQDDFERLDAAQIVIVGESHDNPGHHHLQSQVATRVAPSAVVFEMLAETQASAVTAVNRKSQSELEDALDWEESGWPDFGMYFPIFANAGNAQIYGAQLERSAAREVFKTGIAGAFGPQADQFGLTKPLPDEQQAARETLQAEAHCDALPTEYLPGMVEIQRLREAMLARATLRALSETGGPVLVITGNGHARADWGIPAFIEVVSPETTVFSLGLGEDDITPRGQFDAVLFAPAPEREDPCAAFK